MIPEEMQRTMQFLLDNQAGHDARLAEIELKLDKLTQNVSLLTNNVSSLTENLSSLANTQQEMQEGMLILHREFIGGMEKVLAASDRMEATVRQMGAAVVQVVELEARTIKRVSVLEDRVDVLEN
jgi:hypothetical protein